MGAVDQDGPVATWGLDGHWSVAGEYLYSASIVFVGFYFFLSSFPLFFNFLFNQLLLCQPIVFYLFSWFFFLSHCGDVQVVSEQLCGTSVDGHDSNISHTVLFGIFQKLLNMDWKIGRSNACFYLFLEMTAVIL